jgi:hypothetical protein
MVVAPNSVFEHFSTEAAREAIEWVHFLLVPLQMAWPFSWERAAWNVAFEWSLVPVQYYVWCHASFRGKQFVTDVTLDAFYIFMLLLCVFSEVVAILEELFAFRVKTLEYARRLCIVIRHVQLVVLACFKVLAT